MLLEEALGMTVIGDAAKGRSCCRGGEKADNGKDRRGRE
jgi:hypothetical protein